MISFDQHYPGKTEQQERTRHLTRGYNNVVDHERALIWVMIPKNANSSIKHAIEFRGSKQLLLDSECIDCSYTKIAFVRNPIDRFVSCYKWAFVGKDTLHRTFPQYTSLGVKPGMSFDQWCRVVCEFIPDQISDKHFRSQSARINDVGPIDIIGAVETLDSDWRKLQSMYDLPNLPETKYNQSCGDVVLTAEHKEMLHERYRDDFELWYQVIDK